MSPNKKYLVAPSKPRHVSHRLLYLKIWVELKVWLLIGYRRNCTGRIVISKKSVSQVLMERIVKLSYGIILIIPEQLPWIQELGNYNYAMFYSTFLIQLNAAV